MGTSDYSNATNSPPYGSFGNTKIKTVTNNNVKVNKLVNGNIQHVNKYVEVRNENVKNDDESEDTTDDIDSGMSSEETEDSLKSNLSPDENVNAKVDKQEVMTKCLIIEPQCAERGNEIPSCSNDVDDVSVVIDESQIQDNSPNDKVSEFIVIDLTCDVDNVSELSSSEFDVVDTNSCIECDERDSSVESLSLVPVGNNEIVRRENQKLLSLSLSILLAALLQAMRCFAQFLEDIIVIPHR